MNDFFVTVLGCGSAVPNRTANPSSQIVQYKNRKFLFDCGEGTQLRMIKYNVKRSGLDHVFISHLHGDHFYGLFALLSTFHLTGRKKTLYLYAPHDLEKLIDLHFKTTNTTLSYPLHFYALENFKEKPLYEDNSISVESIPLKHSIPTWGFLIKEKPKPRSIKKTFIQEHQPTVDQIIEVRNGKDFVSNEGDVLLNKDITKPSTAVRSFAYCTDTAFYPNLAKKLKGVDIMYHEASFDISLKDKADLYLHSTAGEAAKIAKMASAKKLLIGHFSNRYIDHQLLLDEALKVFPNTFIAIEGESYIID